MRTPIVPLPEMPGIDDENSLFAGYWSDVTRALVGVFLTRMAEGSRTF
jgi:hypothetical protein